jgi:hypothetical protein
MRILPTGACGALGRAVRRLAEARDHAFVLLDVAEQVVPDGGTLSVFLGSKQWIYVWLRPGNH